MSKVYALKNDVGESVSFHATKDEAMKARSWWRERGDIMNIKPVEYEANRAGVAELLNRFGANS